jgi:hypothetical protein
MNEQDDPTTPPPSPVPQGPPPPPAPPPIPNPPAPPPLAKQEDPPETPAAGAPSLNPAIDPQRPQTDAEAPPAEAEDRGPDELESPPEEIAREFAEAIENQTPPLIAALERRVRQLEDLVARQNADINELRGPFGPSRVFIASPGSTGTTRTFLETVPSGTNLVVMPDGRQVFDSSVRALTPIAAGTNRAYMQYLVGTNAAYVELPSFDVHFGKIQTVGPCNAYAVVKESDEVGNLIGSALITVSPTKGGCDANANGFCYTVGDVIAFVFDPFNPGVGYQLGAYRRFSAQYKCAATNDAHIDDLQTTYYYPSDFHLTTHNACGSNTNGAVLYWRGLIFQYYSSSNCGGTSGASADTISTGGVKILKFDSATDTGGTEGIDYTRFPVSVTCADTTENAPTIGGGPCDDESSPKKATIKIRGQLGVFIKTIDSISCNTNTGQITLNYTTGRAVIYSPGP